LLKSASQVWVTIPAWKQLIRPYTRRNLPIDLLPVPSNIPVTAKPDETMKLRKQLSPGVAFLIGHFGTYGGHTASLLRPVLEQLFATRSDVAVALLGRNGDRFRASTLKETRIPSERLIAPGSLTAEELSNWLTACDLFIQPYAGGISSRNGSLMACLAHGRPVVANLGKLTEPFWQQSNAIALAPEYDVEEFCDSVCRLLSDERIRQELGRQARMHYQDRFDLNRLVHRLMNHETKPEALCESH
jgi:glycosyltransferase involved in cell wall biosynthesis